MSKTNETTIVNCAPLKEIEISIEKGVPKWENWTEFGMKMSSAN